MNSKVGYPLEEYLKKGISAADAITILKQHDCLTFPQLRSGLFPAANFDNFLEDETGMSNAWLRDSSCIGLVLLDIDKDSATRAIVGVISCLKAIRQSFEAVVTLGHAPELDSQRPPVRFTGQDSSPRYDWANAQNDALGYCLQFIGEASKRGVLRIAKEEQQLIDLIVSYLDAVGYWQDADSGHWEEVKKVNASSIGTVVAGLKSVQGLASDSTKIVALIAKGQDALEELLPFESKTSGLERSVDAALLFLIELQRVISEDMAEQIVRQVEQTLVGSHGIRRYEGDSYWGPDYREHFQLGNRTADFSKPSDMALRDSFLTAGGEAQWTLFDPLLSAYYSRKFQKTQNPEHATQARKFISRSLMTVVTHGASDGREVWRIPELFFLEKDHWVPDDHLGLLWSQANVWYGLQIYEEVFGDQLISFDTIEA